MAMTEFEKKMLNEVKGINKELHDLNRNLKKNITLEINSEKLAESIVYSTIRPTT